MSNGPDMVNHPPHYMRGPEVVVAECNSEGSVTEWIKSTVQRNTKLALTIECIEVIRHIHDVRLATAMKYIWRVAFGGKKNNREDIEKAIWYLKDWLDNPVAKSQAINFIAYGPDDVNLKPVVSQGKLSPIMPDVNLSPTYSGVRKDGSPIQYQEKEDRF